MSGPVPATPEVPVFDGSDDPPPCAEFVEAAHNEYAFCQAYAPMPASWLARLLETVEADRRRAARPQG